MRQGDAQFNDLILDDRVWGFSGDSLFRLVVIKGYTTAFMSRLKTHVSESVNYAFHRVALFPNSFITLVGEIQVGASGNGCEGQGPGVEARGVPGLRAPSPG